MLLNKNLFFSIFIHSIVCIHAVISDKLTSVYYGNQGWAMNEVEYFSSWSGKRLAVVLLFTDWCNASLSNLFNIQLNNIWNNGSIPVITWEMHGCGGTSQPGITNAVSNNSYDVYVHQFGDHLRTWLSSNDGILRSADDRRAYLRLGTNLD